VSSATPTPSGDAAPEPPPEEREARERIADLPSELGAVLRPILPDVADEILTAIRHEVDEYRRPFEGRFGDAVRRGVEFALGEFVAMLEDPSRPPAGTAMIEELGRGEVRSGRTLDALQAAYRCGARVAWRRFGDAARESGADQRTLIQLGDAIFAYIHRLAALSVAGWADEQTLRAGATQRARDALVRLVASPRPAVEDLDAAAYALAWPPPRDVAVVVLAGSENAGDLLRIDPGVVAAVHDGAVVGIVPVPTALARVREALRDEPAVLGPTVRWAAAARSYRRARSVAALVEAGRIGARESGSPTLVLAADHLADEVVHADPEAAEDLALAVLGPIERLPANRRARHLETLCAWLDHRGHGPRMADALHLHAQTVRYRVARLREVLQVDLDDPDARFALELALRWRGRRTLSTVDSFDDTEHVSGPSDTTL
jgi:hypothetical protein